MSFENWDNDNWNVTAVDTNHKILHAPNRDYVFNDHDFKEFLRKVNNPIVPNVKIEISKELLEMIRHHFVSLTGLKAFDYDSDNVRCFKPPFTNSSITVNVPYEELIHLTFEDVVKKIDEVLK